MTEFAKGKKAWSISERSGLRFPYKEMVFEEGTKLWVHQSETDGEYNMVDHPQGRVKSPKPEKYILENIYDDGREEQYPEFLTGDDGEPIVFIEMFGVQLFLTVE